MIEEVDLILDTTPALPENRIGRSRELLRAAMAVTKDLISESRKSEKSHAAALGQKGGSSIAAKHGSEYFRELATKRKNRRGGRPPKQ